GGTAARPAPPGRARTPACRPDRGCRPRARYYRGPPPPGRRPPCRAATMGPVSSGRDATGQQLMGSARLVGMNHAALEVGDVDEAVDLYGRLFSFELRGRSPRAAFIDMGDQFL